ncbi:50S ribosomal protein L6 [Candidatus Hecatella orcuttiae]|jgi:large subunit ribosomal protein L6|uniref:50S ribosomal protein L6 n=1 Tax=Candidatus Hecatella orcuttiae TaxID=1935119 RepID=UPI002867DDED|nr:50S ribosomal protein L6 [Candidatus Hecatella orcuttiae]
MVRVPLEERIVEFPEGVTASLEGKLLFVKGPLGELKKDFSHTPVQLEIFDNKLAVRCFWAGKTEKALVGTVASSVKNMVEGVTKGFTYKLKLVSSHFPMTIKVSGKKVLIENFIGERSARVAKIVGDVKISIKGDDIEIQGLSLEDVSQTAANIQQATKIRKKDPRVFLDGIYIYEKKKGS